jgi:uncharacterized membrane protein YeaQ/YmgE (transglycosylase-associated protein family)
MALLLAIIIGVAVGAIGGFLLQENYDLLVLNVLMGLAGAIIGDAVYYFSSDNVEYLLFSWGGAVSQFAGALLFVLLFSMLHKATPNKVVDPRSDDES